MLVSVYFYNVICRKVPIFGPRQQTVMYIIYGHI